MQHIIRYLIVVLFALSVFWGLAQECIMDVAFDPDGHYPYWWERAEDGLHTIWDERLESMGVWELYE